MKVFVVTLNVKPECTEEFLKLTLQNAESSVKEAGNVRFDVLRDHEDVNVYRLLEVWRDDDAIAAHRETLHYKAWADGIKDMLSAPRSKTVSEDVYFSH